MKRFGAIVLCLLSSVLVAQDDELAVAREALRDGLWDVARAHAGRAIGQSSAKLIVLESLAGEGKWEAVGETLKKWPNEKGNAFDYYRAVVKGDHAAAAELLKKGGSADGAVEARLYEAESLARSGKSDLARQIWREIALQTNVNARALALASSNLMDPALLERAYAIVRPVALRRQVGLRLGTVWLRDPQKAGEGERLIRSLVKGLPDAPGAREAFLAMADAKLDAEKWQEAVEAYREAIETWPEASKHSVVQENYGWALQRLGRREEAWEAFKTSRALATGDDSLARVLVKEGDLLSEMGRPEDAMSKYREVIATYPKTDVAARLRAMIEVREMEAEGRRLFLKANFDEAEKVFARVAEKDATRRQRMAYFAALCLYGRGNDGRAEQSMRELAEKSPDPSVRADAMFWLAKFLYNRRDWGEAGRLFCTYAELAVAPESAAEALLWASRAALAENGFDRAIRLSTTLVERYPDSAFKPSALLVQGESLVEQARFDEAVLLFERVALADGAGGQDRLRARLLRADALAVMGADNPARYEAALQSYREVLADASVSTSERLVLSFKIARTLDRLKRIDEAIDQYYVHVVLAYRKERLRGERLDDEASAAFSKSAFRLADEYEGRGKDRQALNVLELVVESGVPAAEEARKRMGRIYSKGGFL